MNISPYNQILYPIPWNGDFTARGKVFPEQIPFFCSTSTLHFVASYFPFQFYFSYSLKTKLFQFYFSYSLKTKLSYKPYRLTFFNESE